MSNQHDHDRDRIAEALDKACKHGPLKPRTIGTIHDRSAFYLPPTIDAAIAAFETLCEPKGWGLGLCPSQGWYATKVCVEGDAETIDVATQSNHAADVCRLVCLVLDREANPPENQCPECGTLMVRSGAVWKCINCGATKEPTNAQ